MGGLGGNGYLGQTLGGNTLGATLGPNMGATLDHQKSIVGEATTHNRLSEFNSTAGGGLLGAISGQETKHLLNPHGTRFSKAQ